MDAAMEPPLPLASWSSLSSRIALNKMPKVYCRPITVKCTVNPPKTTTQPHLPGAPDPVTGIDGVVRKVALAWSMPALL